ncbi:MAG: hypothetical protein IPM64_13200 [Phycisphaerales bacterium]|nr:hypothetical protein [Phycisphaerales bacterium]
MTVVARRVASTPTRTATQTWDKIVEILAPDPRSPARVELAKAAGVACSSISSEAIKDAPIVVWSGGPRVRVYGVFDEDAITGDGVNEDALSKSPTAGDWRMSIPCLPEDVKWSNGKLAAVSNRISARSLEDDIDDDQSESASAARSLTINAEEFLKP